MTAPAGSVLGVTKAPRRQESMARTWALANGVGATFAVLISAVPRPDAVLASDVATLAAPAYLVAAVLWVTAPTMSSLRLVVLTTCGLGLAAAAAATAGLRRPVGAEMALLDHRAWMVGSGALLFAVLVVRHLMVELRAKVHMLDELARIDPLTGVANRRAWDEEVHREISRSSRDRTPLCLAVIDLDHFKAYNDMRGHQEGDVLLQRVAAVWSEIIRKSDFLARYGGEEFAVMLRNCRLEDALTVLERIRLAVGEGQTCSIGLAAWQPGEEAGSLVHRADEALYAAKEAGRDRIKVSQETLVGLRTTVNWPQVILRLLEDRSVIAAYQPVVRLDNLEVVAYEALARPNRRQVDISVELMFSSAQRMGLGRDLDWLCRRAALAGAISMPAGVPLFLNVGVSGLVDPLHRVDQMLLVCEAVGRRTRDVVLEITERELVGDLRRLREVVNTYRREGFRFAVDDVGEGHSTLEVLSVTEPEFIKVARSLVIDASTRGPRAAVRAVVSFAAELDAKVIAEGIETPETARRMREFGVGFAQGFLFGKPEIPALVPTRADSVPLLRRTA